MLLIRCPYCEEERPELEFRNAGEAHIARPTN
ncbi:MAG: sarcosine oxidase subunit delta, partial [Mesorhizobium sp.]